MFITDLIKMENIVENEKHLSWDGWTVVERIQTNKGMTSSDGVMISGKWFMEKRFEIGRAHV
mgnify:CR=1 FL=1